MTLTFALPWLDKRLSPNARTHWRSLASIKKAAKSDATLLTLEALRGKRLSWDGGDVPVEIVFHPPDRRRRDLDNLVGAQKAAQDGVAEALGVDDHLFVPTYRMGPVVRGGSVVWTVGLGE